MKSENFKKWEPINNIPSELFLDSIIDDYGGLTIVLRGEDSDDTISIQFGLFVLSYQSTTETCILKNLDDHLVLKSAWPLFICEDSNYIDLLVLQSYKIIENEPTLHYIIKHADGIIDIVSTKVPDVKWQ
ncbi:hypothetical protein [Pedobacter cryoconitis]|uniref:hypothetical protein n=1 Tax=Pedobacter cryoconitis TaxID=188932 RepID=UPI001609722E|nr:hypothetical protein [Pedobacter cryoconitis]MBB5649163.1 hypothetical protein [Pedobacter cryoconitis]